MMLRAGRFAPTLLTLVLLAAACASSNTVRGVVIDVDGDLNTIRSFTLRADGGELIELVPATDGTFEFPLSHLTEHRQSLSPVEVVIETRDGVEVATSIGDADGSGHRLGG
jgi:hypothetical protein